MDPKAVGRELAGLPSVTLPDKKLRHDLPVASVQGPVPELLGTRRGERRQYFTKIATRRVRMEIAGLEVATVHPGSAKHLRDSHFMSGSPTLMMDHVTEQRRTSPKD